jgi:hypothetical protein
MPVSCKEETGEHALPHAVCVHDGAAESGKWRLRWCAGIGMWLMAALLR